MLIGIIGENCSGKSTLAERLNARLGGTVVSGRDYLRLAKSESAAEARFRERLREAVSGEDLIWVISEPELVKLLPEGAVRVLVKADLETIKARFRARLRGNLPAPVERMLEKKHGLFDGGQYDYICDGAAGDADALSADIEARVSHGDRSPDSPDK